MNFLGGGEHHTTADYRFSSHRPAGARTASPGDPHGLDGRPGDVRHFIHRTIGRVVGRIGSSLLGSVPLVGGLASGIFDATVGRALGSTSVPAATGCPPGFIATPSGCVPRSSPALNITGPVSTFGPLVRRPAAITAGSVSGAFPQPTRAQEDIRRTQGLALDPAAGVAVMGRFGAGFEPSVIMTDTRRCGRGAVLGVDGLCYNRRDLRNSDRFWPRGRRPLLTGGEMRAISTASSAAKKLQRKEKQLQELGLLKKPTRGRRAAPAGHRVQLTHDGGSQH